MSRWIDGNDGVYVAGIGMHAYQFPSETPYTQLGLTAVRAALTDAGLAWPQVQSAYVGTTSIGMAAGRVMFRHLGSTGLAVTQVENASASGSFAFRQACMELASGVSDVVLAVGVDKHGDGRRAADKEGLARLSETANVPAVSRFVDSAQVERYFEHEGHRTVVSQRALQVHTDPLLGHTEIDGVGYVVAELSPYEVDLDWSGITEPSEIAAVVDLLGRATAKIHCASDEDSDQDLVDFQVEDAIADSVEGRRRELTRWLTDFALGYAERVREDHALFVDAFRAGRIGVSAT